MSAAYRAGALEVEGVALGEIAAATDTPVFVYAAGVMRTRLAALRGAFAGDDLLVCYAVKANSALAVIRTLAEAGAGAEVVSGGELTRALAAGVPASRIVFSGVGKSRAEMAQALEAGIFQFNVESVPELIQLGEVAARVGRPAPVALRINPDVAADTHDRISTGRRHDKFGIPYDQALDVYRMAARLGAIEIVGIHLHIGSQILSLAPFEAAYRRALGLIDELSRAGITITRLDLGGGFGARYRDEPALDLEGYAALVRELTAGRDLQLVVEPGRYLVAESGLLVTRVLFVKPGVERAWLILDAGMNTFIRPMLYEAWHDILPVREPAPGAPRVPFDVVGPICESTDLFARDRELPPLEAGDLVALTSAGAYGAVMASDYNSRPRAAEVLVDDGRFAIVRPRIEAVEQIGAETLPPWFRPQTAAEPSHHPGAAPSAAAQD